MGFLCLAGSFWEICSISRLSGQILGSACKDIAVFVANFQLQRVWIYWEGRRSWLIWFVAFLICFDVPRTGCGGILHAPHRITSTKGAHSCYIGLHVRLRVGVVRRDDVPSWNGTLETYRVDLEESAWLATHLDYGAGACVGVVCIVMSLPVRAACMQQGSGLSKMDRRGRHKTRLS